MCPRDVNLPAGTVKSNASQEARRSSSSSPDHEDTTSSTVVVVESSEEEAPEDVVAEPELRATPEMCHYCFATLIHEISKKSTSSKMFRNGGLFSSLTGGGSYSNNDHYYENGNDEVLPSFLRTLPPAAACPLFVTWDKRKDGYEDEDHYDNDEEPACNGGSASSFSSLLPSSAKHPYRRSHPHSQHHHHNNNNNHDRNHHKQPPREAEFELRGCIGTLAPRPLATALKEYTLTSALRDRRFDPIALHEVPQLRVAVSLLVNYEECSHCHDWDVGVHGILIKFSHRSAHYSATYLPEVALEQGWTQQEAIRSLIRKAGFRGDICDALISEISCTRYQSSKRRVTYQEYVQSLAVDPLKAAGGFSNSSLSHDPSSEEGGGEEDESSGSGGGSPRRKGWRSCFQF